MAGNGNKQILGPDGRPLISDVGVAVLKVPKGHGITSQLLQNISMATHCNVLLLPMACELVLGKLAMDEIQLIHRSIHEIEELVKSREKKEENPN